METKQVRHLNMEQNYALIIMAAHSLGFSVNMLDEAESIIKDGKSLEPCHCLWFERSALAAHEEVRAKGLDMIKKANAECDRLKAQYL